MIEGTDFKSPSMKQLAHGAGCCIMSQKSIAITGGTGLIGREAIRFFSEKGYALRILSREERPSDAANVQYFKWNPEHGEIPIAAIEGVHAIIHLAGAPIAQRWSAEYKQTIIDSRVNSARIMLEALKGLPEAARPESIVSASAVGWYASSFEKQSEGTGRAEGFIGDVTEAWESALDGFQAIGMRTVSLRIGLVLAHEGGFLGRLKPLFKAGLGSAIGSGKHWQSWIHITDVVRMLDWAIEQEACKGAFNATSPHPATNLEMSRWIARVMSRPFWAPNVPAFVLRLVFGEMSGILLASHRMDSSRIVSTGFEFAYPTLKDALRDVLN